MLNHTFKVYLIITSNKSHHAQININNIETYTK